ncbi:MAG: protein kinase [Kofleriaceae bacterium]
MTLLHAETNAHASAAVLLGDAGGDAQPKTDGRYTLEHELARGGMGRIWIARDARLSRRVAIKEVIEPSALHARRFERELSLTSRLQHPSIVSIHDAGTWSDGTPFYVMKLVNGEPLARIIARTSTLDDRLALLPHGVALVDALAYAHAQGIVHRDLKPDNVLVGDFGETVVIDWGLAKDLRASGSESSDVTPTARAGLEGTLGGEVLGTPRYMSPEQALGDAVDERADVYALGAVLYHMLSGSHPHDGTSVDEVLVNAITCAPLPLASRAPGVPPDLIAIVEKAMARGPEDRYANAGELAADLKRFHSGQLVGAHRYSLRQLLWRWLRKHRTTVAASSVALVVLATVAVVSVRRIVHEQARADQERRIAVDSRGEAQDLMSFMLVDLRDKLRPLGRLDLLDEAATKAMAYYGRRAGDVTGDERAKLALARNNLGDVRFAQGHADEALREYRAALTVFEALVAERPVDAHAQRNLASTHERIANVVFAQGDAAEALAEYRTALGIVVAAAALAPADNELQRATSYLHGQIGEVVMAQGDAAAALAEYQQGLAIDESLAAKDPANLQRQRDLASSHSYVGDALRARGDAAGALAQYRKAMVITEVLAATHPANAEVQRSLASGHSNVGNVLRAQGDLPGARAEYSSALAIVQRLATNDPTNASRQRDVAVVHDKLAAIMIGQGDLDHAFEQHRATLAIREALTAKDPSNADWAAELALNHAKIGDVLFRQDVNDEALSQYKKALSIFTSLATKDPSNVDRQHQLAVTHNKLGNVLLANHDPNGALVQYRAFLDVATTVAAKDPTSAARKQLLASAHSSIGDVLLEQNRPAEALEQFTITLQLFEALAATEPTNADRKQGVATALTRVGDAHAAHGDAEGTRTAYRAAQTIYEALGAKDPTNLDIQAMIAACHQNIGDAFANQRNMTAARAEYQAGLRLAQQATLKNPNHAVVRALVDDLTRKAPPRSGSKTKRR